MASTVGRESWEVRVTARARNEGRMKRSVEDAACRACCRKLIRIGEGFSDSDKSLRRESVEGRSS